MNLLSKLTSNISIFVILMSLYWHLYYFYFCIDLHTTKITNMCYMLCVYKGYMHISYIILRYHWWGPQGMFLFIVVGVISNNHMTIQFRSFGLANLQCWKKSINWKDIIFYFIHCNTFIATPSCVSIPETAEISHNKYLQLPNI